MSLIRCILLPGYAYYGEYPIHFAAATGNQEIYDYLIDHGADPNAQDTFGNTAVHMVVICNQVVREKRVWIKAFLREYVIAIPQETVQLCVWKKFTNRKK